MLGVLTTALADVRSPSEESLPAAYSLCQNYPNPFNPVTTIRYSVPMRSHVTLEVFNTLGQSVASLINGDIEAGSQEIRFDARNLPSGIFFYRLRIGSFAQTKSMTVLKWGRINLRALVADGPGPR